MWTRLPFLSAPVRDLAAGSPVPRNSVGGPSGTIVGRPSAEPSISSSRRHGRTSRGRERERRSWTCRPVDLAGRSRPRVHGTADAEDQRRVPLSGSSRQFGFEGLSAARSVCDLSRLRAVVRIRLSSAEAVRGPAGSRPPRLCVATIARRRSPVVAHDRSDVAPRSSRSSTSLRSSGRTATSLPTLMPAKTASSSIAEPTTLGC